MASANKEPTPSGLLLARPGGNYDRAVHAVTIDGHINVGHLKNSNYDRLVAELAFAPSINVEQIPQSDLLGLIDRIGNKVNEETKVAPAQFDSALETRMRNSRHGLSNLLANYCRKNVQFPREAVVKIRSFYSEGTMEGEQLERENIGKLIILDERNRASGQSLGIKDQVAREIISELKGPGGEVRAADIERRAIAYTLATEGLGVEPGKNATRDIMYQFIQEPGKIPDSFWQVFGNSLGLETMLAYLREFVKANPEAKPKIDAAAKGVGLYETDEIFYDVGDFYKAVTLENYGPYEGLVKKDLDVLARELSGKDKVVDVGCGQGRHMIPLIKLGIPVEGVDITSDSFPGIVAQVPNAKLHLGSMDKLPFPDGSKDAVYFFGRAFAHMESLFHGVRVLRESRRILGRDGVVLFDLPDITKGEYHDAAMDRLYKLRQIGIWNMEMGAIYDSPDGKHYLDRLTIGKRRVRAMALLAGFKARIVEEAEYVGATGKKATNLYWELKAKPEGFSVDADEVRFLQTHLEPYELQRVGIPRLENWLPKSGMKLNIDDY